MPGPAHTPASRRFLPPSSARNVQSVRPSQSGSSSPFVRTPFPSTSVRRDEIETSFEDEADAPSAVTPAVITRKSNVDRIEDDNHDHELMPTSTSRQPAYPDAPDLDKDDTPTKERDLISSPGHDFPSPLAKRQKIMHPTATQSISVQISSSPAADESTHSESDTDDDSVRNAEPNFESIDQILERSTDGTGPLRAKFRLPARTTEASSRETKRPVSRGVFKEPSTARDPWLETPLPATFSPSKRKGKYDYIHGGMAETVRGWILDIAGKQEGGGTQKGTEMVVKPVLMDRSGRFELVKNEKDETWLLVHQEEELRKPSAQTTEGNAESRTVVLKGHGTVWQLDCPGPFGEDENNILHVSTLWNPS